MTTDNDRVAYLEGEADPSLDPVERAELDELRALLADEAIWASPPTTSRSRRRRGRADASTVTGARCPAAASGRDRACRCRTDHRARRSVRRRSGEPAGGAG